MKNFEWRFEILVTCFPPSSLETRTRSNREREKKRKKRISRQAPSSPDWVGSVSGFDIVRAKERRITTRIEQRSYLWSKRSRDKNKNRIGTGDVDRIDFAAVTRTFN